MLKIKEIQQQIKENKDVLPSRIINGYYVRTIFSRIVGEVVVKVLLVYKDDKCESILQCNVDVENLYGVLFCSDCWLIDDFDSDSYEVAKEVLKKIEVAQGGKF